MSAADDASASPCPAGTAATRRLPDARPVPWTGRMRGGEFGSRLFIQLVRYGGLRSAYLLLYLVALYYLFAAPAERSSSLEYLRRRCGGSLPRRLWLTYRQFCSFGQMLLDRLLLIGGAAGRFACRFEGEEHLAAALREGRGLVLLSAHVGAWESAAHLLGGRLGAPVNVVRYEGEEAPVRALLDAAFSGTAFRPLLVRGTFEDSVELLAALRRGEIVAFAGDRARTARTQPVEFLGAPAEFPVGPYAVAAAAGAPLVFAFTAREGCYRYYFRAEPALHPLFPEGADRADRERIIGECLARYVARLEQFLREYPLQWQNFYPFWQSPAESSSLPPPLGEGYREGVPFARAATGHPLPAPPPGGGGSRPAARPAGAPR